MRDLRFETLGLISYDEGRRIQEDQVARKLKGEEEDVVYFCEHLPVITLGKRATQESLLEGAGRLEKRQITVRSITRGGEATVHSPGQVVVYPVISLRERKLSVRDFVCLLLDATKRVLARFSVEGKILEKPAGLYVSGRKVAAVGMQISRGVTNHGLALNVSNDMDLFSLIVPCGRSDISSTSLSLETGMELDVNGIIEILKEELGKALR